MSPLLSILASIRKINAQWAWIFLEISLNDVIQTTWQGSIDMRHLEENSCDFLISTAPVDVLAVLGTLVTESGRGTLGVRIVMSHINIVMKQQSEIANLPKFSMIV